MDFVATSRRPKSMPVSLEWHIAIATMILFLLYLVLSQLLAEIPMVSGVQYHPFLTFFLYLFGLYIVYISREFFTTIANKCRNGEPWAKHLLYYYCTVIYLLSLAYFFNWIPAVSLSYIYWILFLASLSNLIITFRIMFEAIEIARLFSLLNIIISLFFLFSSFHAFANLIIYLTGILMWKCGAF